MGPGRFNEHTNQHVVGHWEGRPDLHQPVRDVRGKFDITDLVDDFTWAARHFGVPEVEPAPTREGKVARGPVWHCSLRNHASDRVLSDDEWAEVVEDLVDRTGIAKRGDVGGCRWVAIRHADDHVHVAAMLVRQDNGRRVHPRNDYRAARKVCRAAEQRFGLTETAEADRTAVVPPTAAEMEKAARRGQAEPSREWLRRAARAAAVVAQDPEDYFRALADWGIEVRPRELPPGTLVGYSLAAPGDVNAAGKPVWFSGRALARDLALPKLLKRWASAPAPTPPVPPSPAERSKVGQAEREAAVAEAVSSIEHATATLAAEETGAADGIAHAAEDMLYAIDQITDRARPVRPDSAAAIYQRGARTPGLGQPNHWAPVASDLRRSAWRLILIRTLSTQGEGGSAAQLMLAMAALLAEIMAYQEHRRCLAQARASQASRERLVGRARGGGPATGQGRGPTRSRPSRPEPVRRPDPQRREGSGIADGGAASPSPGSGASVPKTAPGPKIPGSNIPGRNMPGPPSADPNRGGGRRR
jgi:hypothetical protein